MPRTSEEIAAQKAAANARRSERAEARRAQEAIARRQRAAALSIAQEACFATGRGSRGVCLRRVTVLNVPSAEEFRARAFDRDGRRLSIEDAEAEVLAVAMNRAYRISRAANKEAEDRLRAQYGKTKWLLGNKTPKVWQDEATYG